MHYWRRNNALQTLGVPQPQAKGPPGSGGHYFFSNNALAGILIIEITPPPSVPEGIITSHVMPAGVKEINFENYHNCTHWSGKVKYRMSIGPPLSD